MKFLITAVLALFASISTAGVSTIEKFGIPPGHHFVIELPQRDGFLIEMFVQKIMVKDRYGVNITYRRNNGERFFQFNHVADTPSTCAPMADGVLNIRTQDGTSTSKWRHVRLKGLHDTRRVYVPGTSVEDIIGNEICALHNLDFARAQAEDVAERGAAVISNEEASEERRACLKRNTGLDRSREYLAEREQAIQDLRDQISAERERLENLSDSFRRSFPAIFQNNVHELNRNIAWLKKSREMFKAEEDAFNERVELFNRECGK